MQNFIFCAVYTIEAGELNRLWNTFNQLISSTHISKDLLKPLKTMQG